jgi:predicted PolB exonuclease-like 3'-5' exonuclease
MTTLVFDIETIPDVALGRRLYNLEGIADADVAKAMAFQQLQATGLRVPAAAPAAHRRHLGRAPPTS